MSIYNKIERNRKPRVHITYNVEADGAEVENELPFVVGVLGDFSGNNSGNSLIPFKDRDFISIDRDNFDDVVDRINPGVSFYVDNILKNDEIKLNINLTFHSMDDFMPAHIIQQIPELRKLKEIRDKLHDLLTKTDRSDELEHLLELVLQDPSAIKLLAKELDISDDSTTKGANDE